MLNPLRIFRRKEQIDDSATAYIEGRATAADEAGLRNRAGSEQGLSEDLESLRQTVSLLRSVEPARAPRSFALSHAPAPAKVSRGNRLALAPAALAIMAVAGVGLLAVGNLADVVQQDDSGSQGRMSEETFITGAELSGTPGIPEPTSKGGETDQERQDSAAAVPGATPGTDGTAGPQDLVPQPTPDAGFAPSQEGSVEPTAPGTEPDHGRSVETVPTSTAGAMDATATENLSVISDEAAASEDGLALPLWQLQAGLGALAVMMAAVWLFLRRRLTA